MGVKGAGKLALQGGENAISVTKRFLKKYLNFL
jgi:hypothetical protein